jgi:hypothetical protein
MLQKVEAYEKLQALYPDELKELRRLIDFSLTDDAIESALSLENYCLN